jgi:ferredoxin
MNEIPALSSRRPFRVVLARSARSLDVPAGRSILDVVLDARVHVRHACHTGHCGACEVKVLDGLPEHFDPVYRHTSRPPRDRMKLCVSRALTPELTLDL